MKKIGIIGVGTAGIQALSHCLAWLNKDWEVYSIYSPKIDIVGIGESTNPSLIHALENGMNFHVVEDLHELDATHKFGTKYVNWRKNEFNNPLIRGSVAIHFNNFKLKEFAFRRFKDIWKNKFQIIEGEIEHMVSKDDQVDITVNKEKYNFDFIMDCRGFPKNYEEYHVIDTPSVNRALVHNVKTSGVDWNYTLHKATKDGWMFGVPLTSRISYGYMFNDKITNLSDAKTNFSKEIGIDSSELENIEYKFNSYYAKNIIDGRICKNGNNAVFFEPLFANSLWLYDKINRFFMNYIFNLTQSHSDEINLEFQQTAKSCHEMICYQYHGGSLYDTPFWNGIKKYSSEILMNGNNFNSVLPVMKEIERNGVMFDESTPSWVFGPKTLRHMDKVFEYEYYKNI